jgi:transcriptional regulator with XRE-family HTH domain
MAGRRGSDAPNRNAPSARAIHRLRIALGLTQQDLADRAGLTRVLIVKVERGRNKATSERVCAGFARAFATDSQEMEGILRGTVDVKVLLAKLFAKRDSSAQSAA